MAHGIFISEQATSLVTPIEVDSAVQVVVGAAPINTGETEKALTPQIAYSYEEAVKKIGYAADQLTYPLVQSIRASFEVYNVCPVVFINVLDPKKHVKTSTSATIAVVEGSAHLDQGGVLLDSISVKVGESATTLAAGTDYNAKFEKDGTVTITAVDGGAITSAVTEIKVSYKQLDPSKITDQDMLDGIRKIEEVYPRFGVVPGLLLCPGWSHKPEIYVAMTAAVQRLNDMFNCMVLADLDTDEAPGYEDCNEIKNQSGLTQENSVLLWPMARVGDDIYYQSTLMGAHIANLDYQNDGVPYVSPSNKSYKISGLCDKTGAEIVLDKRKADLINEQGICTAINFNGWRTWGNYTAGYPSKNDVKDMFISVRRMFLWHGNTFVLTYLSKVDDPMNKRLIESVVDSENIRGNGFKAKGQVAGMKIVYNPKENPETDLIAGKITFHQIFTPFPPAQEINNVLEFDPYALKNALE